MTTKTNPWRLAWLVLGILYYVFGFTYSVIQPLGGAPDEPANMQYVQFMVDHGRLPIWTPFQNSEGGYETQHPPLAFIIAALPYKLTSALEPNMRWQVTRWFLFLVAGTLLWTMARLLSRRLFIDDAMAQLSLTATICLVPLTLMYLDYINPDMWVLLISCTGLYFAARLYGDPELPNWLPISAGILSGLALLTKLNVVPIVAVLIAAQWLRPAQLSIDRSKNTAIIALVGLSLGGWWYARNKILYGTALIHTPTQLGSGWDIVHRSAATYQSTLILREELWTLTNTYMSTWYQKEWLPYSWAIAFLAATAIMIALAIAGYAGRRKALENVEQGVDYKRFLVWASVTLFIVVLIGQESAFWTLDVELNMGGRYMLAALPSIALLINLGLQRLDSKLRLGVSSAWILVLITANIIAIQRIVFVLNPTYHVGWKIFDLL